MTAAPPQPPPKESEPGSVAVPEGVLRRFTLVVGYITVPKPDGKGTKRIVGINGTSPGPELRVRHGDTLAVTVLSTLPDDNTTIHWHAARPATGHLHRVPAAPLLGALAAALIARATWLDTPHALVDGRTYVARLLETRTTLLLSTLWLD